MIFARLIPSPRTCRAPTLCASRRLGEFPDKYDTYIEQGGTNVSSGQSTLKKPKILILDDSTSAVDTKTDKLIRAAFQLFWNPRLRRIIAQRISHAKHVPSWRKTHRRIRHRRTTRACDEYRSVYESKTRGERTNEGGTKSMQTEAGNKPERKPPIQPPGPQASSASSAVIERRRAVHLMLRHKHPRCSCDR